MNAGLPLLMAVAIVSIAQAAPEPAPGTPERIADEQLQALRAADWQKFTARMHGKALARFKENMLPVAAAVWKSDAPPAQNVRKSLFANLPLARLESSPPEIFFERFMQNFAALNPGLTDAYKTTTPAYLGQVSEGEVVHLVIRYSRQVSGETMSEVTVASFEKESGEWRALLSSELEQLAGRLRAQFVKSP
jgi:hypothetical protein